VPVEDPKRGFVPRSRREAIRLPEQRAPDLRPSVLVLTSGCGRGHKAVARALHHLFRRTTADPRAQAATVSVRSATGNSGGLRLLPKIYSLLTQRAPMIWTIYFQMRSLRGISSIRSVFVGRKLRGAIDPVATPGEYKSIVITSSSYCHVLKTLRSRAHTVVVVTDLFGGPADWFLPGGAEYVVPTEYMRCVALRSGIAEDKIKIARLPTLVNGKLNCSHSLRRELLRVLVVGGSGGVGPLGRVAQGIANSGVPVSITIACGTNRRLERRLRRLREPSWSVEGFMRSI
jgi:hypothetical protein